jgi:hypothetical protein
MFWRVVFNTMATRAVFVAAALLASASASDPSYDHQTTTYEADFDPVTTKEAEVLFAPYFSPDHAMDTTGKPSLKFILVFLIIKNIAKGRHKMIV